jgi:hypothetical protein
LNIYIALRANILIGLKDHKSKRTMLVCKAVFDPTTSRWAARTEPGRIDATI